MRSLLRAFFYSSSITNFQGSGSFCYPENRSKHSFFQSSRRRNSPFSTSFLLAKFNQIFTVFAIIFHNNNRVFKLLFLRSHIFIILVILYTFFFSKGEFSLSIHYKKKFLIFLKFFSIYFILRIIKNVLNAIFFLCTHSTTALFFLLSSLTSFTSKLSKVTNNTNNRFTWIINRERA